MDTRIFRKDAIFIAGVAKIDQFPRLDLPQIAFLGKSNVGKSTIINALCNRKSLARTSIKPGCTKQINFFSLGGAICISDLPGYGFAKVSNKQKVIWESIIINYLKNENIIVANILIDSRRGVMKHDLEIISLIRSFNIDFQIIFTKIDKNISYKSIQIPPDIRCNILFTSSKNRTGIEELQNSIIRKLKQ